MVQNGVRLTVGRRVEASRVMALVKGARVYRPLCKLRNMSSPPLLPRLLAPVAEGTMRCSNVLCQVVGGRSLGDSTYGVRVTPAPTTSSPGCSDRCLPDIRRSFRFFFRLSGHLRSHTEERPFVCDWPACGKSFARKHDCNRHQTLHSVQGAQHTCAGCGKSFSRTDPLNLHCTCVLRPFLFCRSHSNNDERLL